MPSQVQVWVTAWPLGAPLLCQVIPEPPERGCRHLHIACAWIYFGSRTGAHLDHFQILFLTDTVEPLFEGSIGQKAKKLAKGEAMGCHRPGTE